MAGSGPDGMGRPASAPGRGADIGVTGKHSIKTSLVRVRPETVPCVASWMSCVIASPPLTSPRGAGRSHNPMV